MNKTSRSTRNTGFTLVELLAVIALIAILAALLLPVLSRTKASAKSAVCKNNLRQLGLALNIYVNDFEAYPLFETFETPNILSPQVELWSDTLRHLFGRPKPPIFWRR